MKIDFGNAGKSSEQNIFQTRLRCRGDGNRISVTPETGRDPENIDLPDRLGS